MHANEAQGLGRFVKKTVIGGLSALSLLGLASTNGWAQTTTLLDPATLHIGPGQGTTCQVGGCPIFGNEVNAFQTQLDIYQQSGGAPSLNTPVLLIFGVPNVGSGALSAGSIGSPTLFSPFTATTGTALTFSFGTAAFGLNGSGFQGDMTAGQEVYGFLSTKGCADCSAGDNSNSFTNWSAADLAKLGITATEYGIYVYAINTAAFSGNDEISLALSGIPVGSFAVGFGESDGHVFATPFTEAGLETTPPGKVPEPGTLLVFGASLLGLAMLRRRRWL
jgi:hypothetical protein